MTIKLTKSDLIVILSLSYHIECLEYCKYITTGYQLLLMEPNCGSGFRSVEMGLKPVQIRYDKYIYTGVC